MGCGPSKQVAADQLREDKHPEEVQTENHESTAPKKTADENGKMRILILVAHVDPTHSATTFRFAESAKQYLEEHGHEVRYVNLIEAGFDRVVTEKDFKICQKEPFNLFANQSEDNLQSEIKIQQDNLKWCTHLVIFAPMWFGRLPATVYAYAERVLTMPFAWDFQHMLEKGYLSGRKATVIITTASMPNYFKPSEGNSLDAYTWSALYAFNYSGFTIMRSFGIHGALSPKSIEKQPEIQKKLNEKLLLLDSWKLVGNKKFVPLATLEEINLDNIVE